jgi:hypothetical protein
VAPAQIVSNIKTATSSALDELTKRIDRKLVMVAISRSEIYESNLTRGRVGFSADTPPEFIKRFAQELRGKTRKEISFSLSRPFA